MHITSLTLLILLLLPLVSGCVNMLENWPCENVGCALGSRRCENAEVQDE